jgi:hypothetical protein
VLERPPSSSVTPSSGKSSSVVAKSTVATT